MLQTITLCHLLCIELGLPPEADLQELHKVYQRSQALHPNPVTVLSALFKDENNVLTMEQRMRISAEERKTALYVIAERGDKPHKNPLKPYQDIVVCVCSLSLFILIMAVTKSFSLFRTNVRAEKVLYH